MIIEVYEVSETNSTSIAVKGEPYPAPWEERKLIYEIEGKDWNDCMQKYYDIMDWGKYKPMED